MSKIKIMLDPGHDYANANRSPVVKSYYEGARMWQLSQLLKAALEKRGFEVATTKQYVNHEIDVVARGRMAEGYDLLLSLHSNACGTESVDRPEGIYLVDDNCGQIDEESKAVAKILAQTVENVMGTDDPAKIYSKLASGDRDGDGKKNDDYYGVLYGAHQVGVPAIILENSFHTNAGAAKWLMKDENLKKLAEAEADALANYYVVEAPSTSSSTSRPAPDGVKWYRVRKSWDDAKSQLGAFLSLENAKMACAAGYTVYDWTGKAVYSKPAKKKTVDQLAREVIQGKWGNGADRKKRLTAAGYDYEAVQTRVNELM